MNYASMCYLKQIVINTATLLYREYEPIYIR